MRRQTNILLLVLGLAVGLYLYSRTQGGQGLIASAADALGNLMSGPRGIRNNNPGNIERNPNIQWDGSLPADQVQAVLGIAYDPVYEQFTDPSYGVRAIGHVLRSKAARGLSSVDAIIRDYSSTDQEAYVANVSAALGVSPFDTVDVYGQLPAFAAAIIQQENGEQPYDPNNLAQWVYL